MAKRDIPSLIIEDHPELTEYSFLSLIEYNGDKLLVVVDNIIDNFVYAYVIDEAIQRKMNLEILIPIISAWSSNPTEPLSFTFARLGVAHQTSLIYKKFEITGVTRLIGTSYKFGVQPTSKIKRRRIVEREELPEINIRQIH